MKLAFILPLFFSSNVFAQTGQPENEFLYQPCSLNKPFSTDSILSFYKTNDLSLVNNYIPRDSCFWNIGRIVQKLNELYLFDSLHRSLPFYEGIHCANNTLLVKHTVLEDMMPIKNTNLYDSLLGFCMSISLADVSSRKYTAIIVWNRSMGVQRADSFIDWERLLKSKYGDDMKIIKINYDANLLYASRYNDQIIHMFEQMAAAHLNAVNEKSMLKVK